MRTTVAALVLLTSMACGSPSETQPAGGGRMPGSDMPTAITPVDPESPVSDDGAVSDGMPVPGKPKMVTPRPGMKDLRPVGWDRAKVRGPRSVLVTYWSGVEPCNVLDHVDVTYNAKTIEITLYEGYDPDEPDAACIEIALLKGVKLTLEEPIDGRKLTDGAP